MSAERHSLQRAIDFHLRLAEFLIARRDVLDGDTDYEPDADAEPWLATWNRFGGTDDREADDGEAEHSLGASEGPDGTVWRGGGSDDKEPSLGSLTSCSDTRTPQTRWAGGMGGDLEAEFDGREPDVDDEDAGEREPDDDHLVGGYGGDGIDQTTQPRWDLP
jgi:hypothetical protein